ncbi:MAG: hypothetical protein PHW75_00585 [Patescibacteria group bacterium]|nr:hypothetical protein [Patescibacteria group bacterium]
MTKTQKISLVALGLALGLGATAVSYANAADTTSETLPPIVSDLTEKFNLNQDEVGTYLAEVRAEHQAERETALTTSLDTALADGKITKEQYDAILERHEEIKATREPMYQNRGKVKGRTDGLRAYLEDEGIDTSILPVREGFGQRNGGNGNGASTCQSN